MKPYYSDDLVQLYHGNFLEVLPMLRTSFALVVADPPYGETSLEWDRWPDGWPEHVTHWYRGPWNLAHHETPRDAWHGTSNGSRSKGASKGSHLGEAGNRSYEDDGTRLARSVQRFPSIRRGIHPTEKPVGLLGLLIGYACPPTSSVLDPFAGSGSTLAAARSLGRRAVGVELREEQCEATAQRLSQGVLDFGEVS